MNRLNSKRTMGCLLAVVAMVVGPLLATSCSAVKAEGVSGTVTDGDGWRYNYTSSFGQPTTVAGDNNCPASPKPGTVNLPFTVTITNVTPGERTAPIPTIWAVSNVLKNGSVKVPIPDPDNEPSGGTGFLNLTPVGFTKSAGEKGCTPDSVGLAGSKPMEPSSAVRQLGPNKSLTFQGFVFELPEKIPADTAVILGLGPNPTFTPPPTATWVIRFGETR